MESYRCSTKEKGMTTNLVDRLAVLDRTVTRSVLANEFSDSDLDDLEEFLQRFTHMRFFQAFKPTVDHLQILVDQERERRRAARYDLTLLNELIFEMTRNPNVVSLNGQQIIKAIGKSHLLLASQRVETTGDWRELITKELDSRV
jgi:hypothetical protein